MSQEKTIGNLQVVLDAKIAPFKQKLEAAKKETERCAKTIDQALQKAGQNISGGNNAGNLQESMQKVEESLQAVNESAKAVNEAIADVGSKTNTSQAAQAFQELEKQIENCKEDLIDYRKEAASPIVSPNTSPETVNTGGLSKNTEDIQTASTKLQAVNGIVQKVVARVQEAVSVIPKIGSVISEAANDTKKGFSMMASAAQSAYAGIRKSSGTAAALIQKFSTGIPAVEKLSSALKNLGKQGESSSKGLNTLKGSLSRIIGVILGIASIKSLVEFGKSCIELGSDLAEVQNVVEVTFPSMTQAVNEFAQNAATTHGLSETMAKQYTGMFGSMAEAFGFSEQAAYEMSTTLTGLSGDVASFYNISQDEAYTKLKSVFSGETETLKDLGIVMTQTALDAYALANGFGKTTANMTEMEKVSLRYAFVQDQLTNAAEDFAKTSDSWANQVRILTLQFDSLKATIGQGLINILTPVIKIINQAISKVSTLANAFKSFTELITGGKADVGSGVGSVAVEAADATSGLTDAASAANDLAGATSAAGDAAEKAAKQALGLMAFDSINKLSESSTSSGNSGSGGSGSGSGAGSSLSGDTVDYGSLAETTEQGGALGKALADAIQVFKDAWDAKGQLVMDSWKGALESVKAVGIDVGNTLLDVWNDGSGYRYCTNILDLVADLGQGIDVAAASFRDAWNDGGNGYNYIESIFNKWNAILELIHAVSQSVITVWGNGTGADILGNWLQICTNINNSVGNIAAGFEEAWKEAGTGTGIIQNICDIVDILLSHVNNITGGFEKWTGKLDFGPLLKSIEGVTGSLEFLADDAGIGLEWLFSEVLQPFGKWTMEKGAPAAFDTISSFLEACDAVLDTVGPQLEDLYDGFFKPMASFTADKAVDFMETLQDLLDSVDSDTVVTLEGVGLSILSFKLVTKAKELAPLVIKAIKDKLETLILTAWEIKDYIVSLDLATATIGFTVTGSPNVAYLLDKIIEPIDEYLSEHLPDALMDAIGGAIAGMVVGGTIGAGIGLIGGPIGMLGGAIAGAIIGAIINEFAQGNWDFGEIAATLLKGIAGTLTGAAAGFAFAGPAGAIVGAIAGAIGGFAFGDDIIQAGKDIIKGLFKGITDFFSDPVGWIGDHIVTPFVEAVKDLFGIHSPSTVMAEIGGYLIEGLFKGITDFFSDPIGWIREHIFQPFVDGFSSLFGGESSEDFSISLGIGAKIEDSFTKAKEAWDKFKDSEVVKKAKGAVTSAFNTAKDTFDKFKNSDAVKTVKGAVTDAFNTAKNAFDKLKDGTALKSVTGAVKDTFTKAKDTWDKFKDSDVVKSVKGTITGAFNTAKNTFDKFKGNTVTKTVTGALTSAFNTAKDTYDKFKDSDAVKTVKSTVTDAFNKAKDAFGKFKSDTATKTVKSSVEKAYTTAKTAYENFKNSTAVKTVKSSVEKAYTTAKSTWDSFKSNTATKSIKSSIAKAYTTAKTAYEKFKSNTATKTLKTAGETAFNKAKKNWDAIKSKSVSLSMNISAKVSDIKSWINTNLIDKVNTQMHKISLLKSISIPRLAQGGYVKANTPQLALIGDNTQYGEIVAPENKLLDMAMKAANLATQNSSQEFAGAVYQGMVAALKHYEGNGGNVTIILEGDAKKFFKAMQAEAKTYVKTHKASPFPI